MSTTPEQLHYLLQQYAGNQITRKELLELLQAINEAGNDDALQHSLQSIWQNMADTDVLPAIDKEKIFSHVIATPAVVIRPKRFNWLKIAAAATLILALGTVAWWYIRQQYTPAQSNIALFSTFKNDNAARLGKAVLLLADGREIVLDDVPVGTLARQGHITIIKQDNRQLVYKTDPQAAAHEAASGYNTLITPAGKQYQVVLPDGSHVWLNAASAIRYPTTFPASERNVAMTGEAYFEVNSLASTNPSSGGGVGKTPFIVDILRSAGGVAEGRVEVLGTHFNINAYDNETTAKTTLLEGKVKVSAMSGSGDQAANQELKNRQPQTINYKLLSPGQQAQISNNELSVINTPDLDNVIAWKRGELIFNNVTIAEAARMIERWYNVRVVIETPRIASCRITVPFLKGETIQQVMDVISAYNQFTWQIQNGTITWSGNQCN